MTTLLGPRGRSEVVLKGRRERVRSGWETMLVFGEVWFCYFGGGLWSHLNTA